MMQAHQVFHMQMSPGESSQVAFQAGVPYKEPWDLPEGARKSNEGGAFAQPTVVGQQQAFAVRPALPQVVDCLDLVLVQVRTMLLQGADFPSV